MANLQNIFFLLRYIIIQRISIEIFIVVNIRNYIYINFWYSVNYILKKFFMHIIKYNNAYHIELSLWKLTSKKKIIIIINYNNNLLFNVLFWCNKFDPYLQLKNIKDLLTYLNNIFPHKNIYIYSTHIGTRNISAYYSLGIYLCRLLIYPRHVIQIIFYNFKLPPKKEKKEKKRQKKF